MLALLLLASAAANAKYDDYIHAVEAKQTAWNWSEKVRNGRVVVEPANKAGDIDVGGALIHDWIGSVFIPGTTLDKVLSFLQDYDIHEKYYAPEVLKSHLVSHEGDQWKISFRLVQNKVVKVVLDVDQTVMYRSVSPTRVYETGVATRIVEASGKDHGYLWRLNTFVRLEEKDGGVYMESRAVSLSRTPPFGLGWLFNPIVRSLPSESLTRQLTATRKAVLSR
ncbi:MAG TPA: hypothetical protein VMJ34_20840 [Bryobacteraceae bacterium]|nr:hypothetical protein [Bryobacteraceae bacterium]